MATSSSPDQRRFLTSVDEARMLEAIGLAHRGWGQVSPNPLVGAVVTNGGKSVGTGFHGQYGGPHAEVVALEEARENARGGTLYVNLEPCNHHGNTPPCTDKIIAAGISRVVAAIQDPNLVASGGAEKLRAAGIVVEFGVCEKQARDLNAAFLNSFASNRPWVTLKLAMSLDGSIAPADRSRVQLTNETSAALVHRMRAGSDAIAVGSATAKADDPLLTARTDPPPRVAPTRVIFDRNASLSSHSQLAKTARDTPTLLVTTTTTQLPADLENLGVRAIRADDPEDALVQLKTLGINSMLVEGGAGLAASFLGAHLVDRLVIFHAPLILGSGSLNAFAGIAGQESDDAPRFRVLSSATIGDDIMTTYAVEKH